MLETVDLVLVGVEFDLQDGVVCESHSADKCTFRFPTAPALG